MTETKDLTPKQKAFVDEYMKDLNATQASIRAGYSKKTANEQASRLLVNVNVMAYMRKRMAEREKRTEITQDRVLQEVARLAFLDIRKAFNPDGTLKPLDEIDEDTAAALAGLEMLEEYEGHGKDRKFVGYSKKLKLSDKKGALELLMRHLGMLNDKMKLQGDPENPVHVSTKVVVVPQKNPAVVEKRPVEKE